MWFSPCEVHMDDIVKVSENIIFALSASSPSTQSKLQETRVEQKQSVRACKENMLRGVLCPRGGCAEYCWGKPSETGTSCCYSASLGNIFSIWKPILGHNISLGYMAVGKLSIPTNICPILPCFFVQRFSGKKWSVTLKWQLCSTSQLHCHQSYPNS